MNHFTTQCKTEKTITMPLSEYNELKNQASLNENNIIQIYYLRNHTCAAWPFSVYYSSKNKDLKTQFRPIVDDFEELISKERKKLNKIPYWIRVLFNAE